MSKDTLVAKRYAKALFEVAETHGMLSDIEDDLRSVVQIIGQTEGLSAVIGHPNIDESAKKKLLKEAFDGKVSSYVLHTILLLIDRGRENLFDEVLEYFVVISNEALGQAEATVYTPQTLLSADEQKLAEQFGKMTGKKLRISSVVNPALIGGLQVRIGDTLYDGSISGKLARLEKSLNQAQAL